MTFLRMPAAQIFDGEELQLWQPVPGKRTLTQDLPAQRKAGAGWGGMDAAAVMAAIAPEGSGPTRAAHVAGEGVRDVAPDGTTSVAAAPANAPRQPTTAVEDPFSLHLMSDRAGAASRAGGAIAQRKAMTSLPGVSAAPELEAPSGGGQALPEALRAKMDAAFGFDFSAVRVHEGAHVGGMGALAYAQGSELHFAPGQYDPHSERGQELIGHELAHVVQQAQGRVQATGQAKGAGGAAGALLNDDAGLEREADELGARAARGERVGGGAQHTAETSLLGGAREPVQMRAVKEVAQEGSVVVGARDGTWMLVNGLDRFGFAKWHLTIFPSQQESWRKPYKLPASGKRPVADWMQFDEFHLTFEGQHFFYTDQCVPLAGSMTSGGQSPAWNHERWAWANYVCANYFGVSQEWLDNYVREAGVNEKAERDEQRAEERHQELMWKRYLHWVKQRPEIYAKTQKTFEAWSQELMDGFQGSYQEFREQIAKEEQECGGKLPDYPKRQWREETVEMHGELVEVYGYEEEMNLDV